MRKTNLLICGNCEQQGIREIVGEVDQEGAVLVQRFHRGYTKITGTFNIVCGRCGNEIFFKERRQDEGGHIGITWIHWITFMPGTISQRIQLNSDYTKSALLTNGTTRAF